MGNIVNHGTWPPSWDKPHWKDGAAATKKAKRSVRAKRRTSESRHKQTARGRDGRRCRFPLCGCRRKKFRIEVSHDRHKGAGGDPSGQRSLPEVLITLCLHRHQTGPVSMHKRTLRTVYLTARKNNGPVAWQVKVTALRRLLPGFYEEYRAIYRDFDGLPLPVWYQVAFEIDVQQLGDLDPLQVRVLERLARMDV